MISGNTLDAPVVAPRTAKPLARHSATAARVAMGLVFFVCGLNGFLNFLPQPSNPVPEGALSFGAALMATGYMFPLITGTEVIAGALLLSNRFVPLALAILAPVIVNIVAFHAFLAQSGLGFAVVLFALEVYLAWTYRGVYRAMLLMRAAPARCDG